jgi:hypothetical protein
MAMAASNNAAAEILCTIDYPGLPDARRGPRAAGIAITV